MVRISVFGKQGCPKCDTTHRKISHFLGTWGLEQKVTLVFHDMDTLDGRAEGAFYDVRDIPVTLIERDGLSLARWDGEVPNSQRVRHILEDPADAAAH